MTLFWILLGLYLVLGTVVSAFVFRARASQEEYFIAGRMISGLVSAGTYAATTYSAFMMVGLLGLAFKTGVGSLLFEMCYLVATLVLLAVYGKKIWELAKNKGLISPMELYAEQFGPASGAVGTVIATVALIPYTASQVIGLGLILQSYSGYPFVIGAAFAIVIIALWAFLGGMRGVAITDALQGALMLIIALAALVWSGVKFKGLDIQSFPNAFWTPVRFVNLTLPWIFFALNNPQVMQRLFIPKDRKAFNRMILYFGLFGLLYTLMVTLIGFAARYGMGRGVFPDVADRDKVILEVMARMGQWLAMPVALSIMFAAVTTANSIILTLSSMVVRDLFREKGKIWIGKIFIVLLSLAVFLFAFTRPSYIVELSVASSAILLCFLPLTFAVLHWRKHGGPVTGILTMVVGAAVAIVLAVLKVPLSALYTLIVAFAVYFLAGLFERRKQG